ncbi:hypothetical protein NONI108955_21135 [Nocardia ninae]|uniref:Uncharacterized protein n=1 Tax=Nocardia ninae NBRC 108245 TaxID=1210091 RepID=A0A511MA43_9NOCA|nr:hypothetical protein [Nocardia ninae]GEM37459.1 hypothetical protein NN4_19780 [Nocardia ninae NBRC 108245]
MLFWLILTCLAMLLPSHAVADYTRYHRTLTAARLRLQVSASIAMFCAGIICAIPL